CPEMGNVGTNTLDQESARPHAVGMVVRSLTTSPSNWRSEEALDAYLKRHGVVGILGLDTRMLVRHVRLFGAQMGILSSDAVGSKAVVEGAVRAKGMEGQDLASGISTQQRYVWAKPSPTPFGEPPRVVEPRFDVVAYDFGLKRSMLEFLVDVGCRVTVVPAAT